MTSLKLFFRKPGDPAGADLIEIDVNPDELVEFVRKRVAKKGNVDCAKLIFQGKTCSDDKPLRFYNVDEGETLIIQTEGYSAYPARGGQKRHEKSVQQTNLAPLPKKARLFTTEGESTNVAAGLSAGIKVSCVVYGEKGVRRRMEDDHIICCSIAEECRVDIDEQEDVALFCVLDGHGGADVVQFVKEELAKEIGKSIAEQIPGDRGFKDAINAACSRLDGRIVEEVPQAMDGCCAVFAMLQGQMMYVANVGDSMAYLSREDEEEKHNIPLTIAHKCWSMKEKDRISRHGGRIENGRIDGMLEVSRAFGDLRFKKFGVLSVPTFKKFEIDTSKDKFVLLGSDGFWGSWSTEDAMSTTREFLEKNDAKATCRLLVRHVIDELKSQDNVTAMLITF